MKLREVIILFLFGVLIGVTISPFTDKTPRQAILSPLSQSKAGTNISPKPALLGVAATHFKDLLETGQEASQSSEKSLPNEDIFTPSDYSGKIKVAVFGDSMIDVMEDLAILKASLQSYYPEAQLELFNYGLGAENIEDGFARLDQDYHYQNRNYPSLLKIKPDIVILGSFSYNPFAEAQDELYRHWAGLIKITGLITTSTQAKIIILAEIAPNKEKFGQGPKGVNWTPDFAWEHAKKIQQYLENTINFAQTYKLNLVDVYHKTLNANGEGNLLYINSDDHIHQNLSGNNLIAQLLTRKIFELKLF